MSEALEREAREMLAQEYERRGDMQGEVRSVRCDDLSCAEEECAIRVIAAVLTEKDMLKRQVATVDASLERQFTRAQKAEAEVERLREALTPSGATKAAYIGEIKDAFVQYDEFGDEQYCTRPVSWDATKATMKMILTRAALSQKGRTDD